MAPSSPTKNIVVIGLAGAGLKAFSLLIKEIHSITKKNPESAESSIRVIGVEKSNYAFWPPGALRASISSGFEDQILSTFDHIVPAQIKKDKPDLANVSTGTEVTGVDFNDRTISLKDSLKGIEGHGIEDGGKKIKFDYLIIATGSTYPFPCRPSPEDKDQESIKQRFQALQNDIKASESVLVVGAGAVGIEFAGEVSYQYKDKNVTLVCSSPRLVPDYSNNLAKSLNSQLGDRKVKVLFNSRVDLNGITGTTKLDEKKKFQVSSGEEKNEVEADFVFLATGNKPNTSFVPEESLNSKTKQIKVNSNLQVLRTKSGEEQEPIEGVYGIGDVVDFQESKMFAALDNQASDLVKNILVDIKTTSEPPSEKSKKLKKVDHKPFLNTISIPLGPSGGGTQLFGVTFGLGACVTSLIKGKSLFLSMFKAMYPSKEH